MGNHESGWAGGVGTAFSVVVGFVRCTAGIFVGVSMERGSKGMVPHTIRRKKCGRGLCWHNKCCAMYMF